MLLITLLASIHVAEAGDWESCMRKQGMAWSQDLARYHAVAELDEAAAKQAALKLDESPEAAKSPHRFGTVEVILRRLTIESANLKYATFIWVNALGKKIAEVAGPDDIGEMPPAPGDFAGSGAYWWNLVELPVPTAEPGLTLHVVDALHADKCVFEVSASGKSGMKMREYVK